MRVLITALFSCLVATTTHAQDNPNTILVMDGSGSMWGQIDGVAKITIAQDVVGDLLDTLPADQRLGLTVYGHRERGNCSDIETVVAPAPGTRDAILAAVNAIKPLGKTPMIDSIIAAAEALRYTEDSATVILISDGVETCNPDPCAAARLLEEAGIGFTAHVIGFDVGSDAVALAQMQCIAGETGGQFLTADNATELSAALTAVVQDPEPAITALTLEARIGDVTGPLITDQILWSFAGDSDMSGNPFEVDITEGSYDITATWVVQETSITETVQMVAAAQTQTFVFPEPVATATLNAPDTAPVGSTIQVGWDGPNLDEDWVGIGLVDGQEPWKNFFYTRDGDPGSLLMPTEPGDYLIQYFQVIGRPSIASIPITLTPVTATIDAPAEATIGSEITVNWTGPDYDQDFIGIGMIDATGSAQWKSYFYTEVGPQGTLTMPAEPGAYVIQYFFGQGQKPLMGVPITVNAIGATLNAPDSAIAGDTIKVDWTGPDHEGDYITVSAMGEDGYINYTSTEQGSPLDLQMPTEPGDYEIRYVLRQDTKILATIPIAVTELAARVVAQAEAPVGAEVSVGWEGPDYQGDYIAVGEIGEGGYINYTSTSEGNPLDLQMPTEPGNYEIRYHLRQGNEIIATQPITVVPLEVSVNASGAAPAGSNVTVNWTGPDYEGDYIAVGVIGEGGYINYTVTSEGNPLELQMPPVPGSYEIRYHLRQDNEVLATKPIDIYALEPLLTVPATALAGETVSVVWEGPDYQGDYIAVGEPGENGYINYTNTEEGSPLGLQMPAVPGDYEVRYTLRQDNTVIIRAPISVAPLKVQMVASDTATAGTEVVVGWEGPDYTGDYIAISKPGEDGYVTYANTDSGNPTTVRLPDTPGDYEIRYVMRQDNTILARLPLTLTAP